MTGGKDTGQRGMQIEDSDDDMEDAPGLDNIQEPSSSSSRGQTQERSQLPVLDPTMLWFDDNKVMTAVSGSIIGYYRQPWRNYGEVDATTMEHWWNLFCKEFTWAPELVEDVKHTFEKSLATRLRDMFYTVTHKMRCARPAWLSEEVHKKMMDIVAADPTFKARSSQNKKNRRGGSMENLVEATHYQGSMSAVQHAKRMAAKIKGKLPTAHELFIKTHFKEVPGKGTVPVNTKAQHIAVELKKEEEKIGENEQEKKETKIEENMQEKRGSIAFFATYRPPVPLDIYSAVYPPTSPKDEALMTDGKSYNYNGQVIPPSALKTILKRPKLASYGTEEDVDSGRLSGLIFVSERTNSLETLHIALLFQGKSPEVFCFADVYDTFKGVRMEDSGCIAGDYLVYVSTMEAAPEPHQPWTAVYKTNLITGQTERLTLPGKADLSPSVSPDGKRIAVASFQRKAGWDGEVEDLKTSIFVMNVERPLNRKLVVVDGGWPTWGSDNVLFFHRNIEKVKMQKRWGVFRVDLRLSPTSVTRVTPEEISAMTPAAIDETKIVVATIRKPFTFDEDEREEDQYRHIEIFDLTKPKDESVKITQVTRPKADHFNPFVIEDNNGKKRIGYHRCNSDKVNTYNVVEKDFYKLQSPDPDIGIFRVSGVFPTISECGRKLAFVDNEFKAVWVADSSGLHMVYETNASNSLFSPVWNTKKDTLYVCEGPSFNTKQPVQVVAIFNVLSSNRTFKFLTNQDHNSAFPSTNPNGTRLVYRSTKDGPKNLYIMENAELGEFDGGKVTRLTEGNWTDTHCHWSPKGDWIAFSSNRANPTAKGYEDLPDPGYFGVYLVNADDKNVVVKVIDSGYTYFGVLFAGHVNHPIFSPDGKSLVITADFAAVSCDPISMPIFVHSVRPYGDIFVVDIDLDDIYKNENLNKFTRLTHSKYENATATWTMASAKDLHAKWNVRIAGNDNAKGFVPECPYVHQSGAESVHMTGHLCISDRCC